MVSVRQAQGGDEYFIGEHGVRDVPVGEPFELEVGAASDVTVTQALASSATIGSGSSRRVRIAMAYTLTNAGAAPALVEVRQDPQREGFRIVTESGRHVLKNGADVWRVSVPANGDGDAELHVRGVGVASLPREGRGRGWGALGKLRR